MSPKNYTVSTTYYGCMAVKKKCWSVAVPELPRKRPFKLDMMVLQLSVTKPCSVDVAGILHLTEGYLIQGIQARVQFQESSGCTAQAFCATIVAKRFPGFGDRIDGTPGEIHGLSANMPEIFHGLVNSAERLSI